MKESNISLAIKNCQIVLENGILYDGVILLSGERISAFGKEGELRIPGGVKAIDAEGAYVGPGFIDIHVHGADGKNINFDTEDVADYFLRHGTTSILASPWYKLNFDTFMSCIKNVKEKMGKVKTLKGLYLEGPYTNPKYGSHAKENPWRHGIVREEYRALVDEAGELAKVWTVAPELDGLSDFLAYAKEVNPSTVFAVGHSEATPNQIRALGKYRPTLQTHAMNATGRTGSHAGIRGVGPDEYCLCNNEVFCELISDSLGIHVNTELQRLLLHAKGAERIVLITDGSAYNNPPPEEFKNVKDINFSPYGEVAGSRLTMDKACRNIMLHTNASISQAFLMASTNPAKVIGLYDELGSIDVGKIADLVIVDDKFGIKNVILGGEICKL